MRNLTTVVAALALGLAAGTLSFADYSYTRIADSSGTFRSFGQASINSAGQVAFGGFPRPTGISGAYRGDGATPTTIADSRGDGFGNFTNAVGINDGGAVAFLATRDGASGVFAGDGSAVPVTIASSAGGVFTGFQTEDPQVNASGRVAFLADRADGTTGVFTGTGGPLTTVASTAAGSGYQLIQGAPDINDRGAVAFLARLDSGRQGVFVLDGGALTTIASRSPGSVSPYIALNDANAVAFLGDFGGGSAIFVGDGSGAPRVVADTSTSGPFSALGLASINDSGAVAFFGTLRAGSVRGIFAGPDPMADAVIRVGDALDGSTVTSLGFWRGGLNDSGQVAFRANLADGRAGIYRASVSVVPEPASMALLGLGGLLIAGLARRRRS